ncbi:MAG: GNAT family N-acetyltransferase [Lactovum sp.]
MRYLRRARLSDLECCLEIINDARAALATSGTGQWQGLYPARENLEEFIKNEVAYVFFIDDEIVAFSALIQGEDKAYTEIKEGSWSNESLDYLAIHCLAILEKYRGQGLMTAMFSNIFSLCLEKGIRDIRIDTHPQNQAMLSVIKREGFVYCGKVWIDGERVAFQLELNK